MNRSIVVALIAVVFLAAGAYLYLNSQKEKNVPQQTRVHGTTAGGHQPITQGQRSYEPEITSDTTDIKPNQSMKFSYKIKNDKGVILKNYEIVHEKIMHFIVVRKDLQNFQHLHPDSNQATGEFTVNVTFPTDGPYRVFPDFTLGVENPQKLPVTVSHDIDVGDMNKYKAHPVIPDTQPKKTFDGYQVIHNLPNSLVKQQEVSYNLNVERNGQPVTDLQPYLGALGHSVILQEGTLDFIHTHAGEQMMQQHGSTMGSSGNAGPKIAFATSFPQSGVYKIFTQFQHQNKVVTADYVIKVN